MGQLRRIVPLLVVLGIALVVLTPSSAGAQTATCVAPAATDIRTPTGAIDVAGYQAAVAAFNVCVSGISETRSVAAPAPSSTLAFTGSNSTTFAVIAVAVIGLGAGAVFVSRRRRVE